MKKQERFEILGNLYRKARRDADITQTDIAQMLGYSSCQMVSKWERGLCAPPVRDIRTINKILGLNPSVVRDTWLKSQDVFISQYL